MVELLFILACILIYLYSFLYRNFALVACAITVYVAYLVEVNLYFVVGMIAVLTIIRLNKTGVRDEF